MTNVPARRLASANLITIACVVIAEWIAFGWSPSFAIQDLKGTLVPDMAYLLPWSTITLGVVAISTIVRTWKQHHERENDFLALVLTVSAAIPMLPVVLGKIEMLISVTMD